MKFKWKSFFRNEDTCFERIKIFSGGTKALVWCEDGNLYVWSLLTCRQLTRCEFEAGGKVICSDITANEELLASVSSDQTIVLWRAYGVSDKLPKLNNGLDNRGLEIYRYRLAATPSCCRFESRGHFLAIGDMEGHLHVLDLLKESIMVFEDRLQSDAVQFWSLPMEPLSSQSGTAFASGTERLDAFFRRSQLGAVLWPESLLLLDLTSSSPSMTPGFSTSWNWSILDL